MEGRIVRLPDELVNRIAAGEVVERPASAVKELIENSIDAGAGAITVEVKGSGKRYIRVTDDGSGMAREDAVIAFERHATSKIKTVHDLHKITTLGFRGEALPSIASVSKVRLLTCAGGDSAGTEIELDNGAVKAIKDAPPVKGTSIEVKDLFLNIPARLKFLKSDTTELSHIIEAVNQHALSHSSIRFKMINGNKTITDTASTNNILDRIASIFGYEITDNLIPITPPAKGGLMRIEGYISRPSVNMAGRNLQYIFVNNRYIKDRVINHAVYDAFKTMLPRDRHPVYFLFLNIDPAMVDVNVHPAKIEVRFARQGEVHDFVRDVIRESMTRSQKTEDRSQKTEFAEGTRITDTDYSFSPQHSALYKDRVRETIERYISGQEPGDDRRWTRDERRKMINNRPSSIVPPPSSLVLSPETESNLSQFKPVGQIFDSFIILEGADNIIFIDQHTAHERILYERFLQKVKDSKIEVQALLLPLNMEMSGKESIILQSSLDNFKKLGFDIESFGENSFIIRSVPSILSGDDYKQLIKDILDKLVIHQQNTSFDEIVHDMILVMACRGAVKANQKLNMEEMESLMKELMNTSRPFTCPHGRPIALSMDKGQILKGFLRR
ncbi:MAG: DNA mismatch repair endonuclease MutL [Nitrospinae bacterium]|nr:DNA mismatch repair endonuclease MutL [Nitrospinota bacterium]MBI3814625.1 DNA mismatch repair endonuclease MutL [Nitrospinota bacterium]